MKDVNQSPIILNRVKKYHSVRNENNILYTHANHFNTTITQIVLVQLIVSY